jgi:hypothetical protein
LRCIELSAAFLWIDQLFQLLVKLVRRYGLLSMQAMPMREHFNDVLPLRIAALGVNKTLHRIAASKR